MVIARTSNSAELGSGRQPGIVREDGRLDPVLAGELAEQVADVRLDRSFGQVERACDLQVAPAAGDPVQDLAFAVGECRDPIAPAPSPDSPTTVTSPSRSSTLRIPPRTRTSSSTTPAVIIASRRMSSVADGGTVLMSPSCTAACIGCRDPRRGRIECNGSDGRIECKRIR
jgi:hypothetical protein